MSSIKRLSEFVAMNEYKAHGSYDPHEPNDQNLTAGKGKLDKQYHKAEQHVSSKHGSNGYSYAHHKGDTAVLAMTGAESSPYSHKEGSSSLGNHDTHNITAVVHKDGSTSGVNLKYGQRATHHDVMKQAPKVHHSLAKKIAHEHNSAAAKVTESVIYEAAIHTHKDGTTVHHSDEDRGEIYSIKHGGKTHTVNTHAYTVPGETVADNVEKHIRDQAPNIPSHAKSAIVNHMKGM